MIDIIHFVRTNWVKINRLVYNNSSNSIVDDLPQFVKIINILVISGFILHSVEVNITIGVHDHILRYFD